MRRGRLYEAFWTRFLDRLQETHPHWTGSSVASSRSWLGFRSTLPHTHPTSGFTRDQRLRQELFIDSGDKTRNQGIFDALLENHSLIESTWGRSLSWEPLPDKRMCRVAEYRHDGDVTQWHRHDEFIDWFLDAGIRLRRATEAYKQLND